MNKARKGCHALGNQIFGDIFTCKNWILVNYLVLKSLSLKKRDLLLPEIRHFN